MNSFYIYTDKIRTIAMSDFNLVGSFKPKVENTFFNKGGGGGNTGYFSQGRKKKDDDDKLIGKANQGISVDKFTESSIPDFEEAEDILSKIKGFLSRIR